MARWRTAMSLCWYRVRSAAWITTSLSHCLIVVSYLTLVAVASQLCEHDFSHNVFQCVASNRWSCNSIWQFVLENYGEQMSRQSTYTNRIEAYQQKREGNHNFARCLIRCIQRCLIISPENTKALISVFIRVNEIVKWHPSLSNQLK